MSNKIDNILNLFIVDSYRKFNVREVARLVKISPSTASLYMNRFVKKKLLKKEINRNLILYSADQESREFRDMKTYENIKKIRNSGIVDFIEGELNYPEAIILFGSYAKGENKKDSDIDLFVLSESKNAMNVEKFEKIIGTDIQVFIFDRKEFDTMKLKNKELMNNFLNGIIISGFLEVFR